MNNHLIKLFQDDLIEHCAGPIISSIACKHSGELIIFWYIGKTDRIQLGSQTYRRTI